MSSTKTVAEMAHETMRDIDRTEVEAKERARIYRAKLSRLRQRLHGLINEDAGQVVSDDLLCGEKE